MPPVPDPFGPESGYDGGVLAGALLIFVALGAEPYDGDLPVKARLEAEERQKLLSELNDYVRVCEDVGPKFLWSKKPAEDPFEICLDKALDLLEDVETFTAGRAALRRGLLHLYHSTAVKVLPRLREAARNAGNREPTSTWVEASFDRTHQATTVLPSEVVQRMEKRLSRPKGEKPVDLLSGP